MRLKFKTQAYQLAAVKAVADVFLGQSRKIADSFWASDPLATNATFINPANPELSLEPPDLLANLRAAQGRQNLPLSEKLSLVTTSPVNLDVEMETGTGKTYCYIRTIFELYKRYGFSKFIIIVPSVAIREGVLKSLETLAEHFFAAFGETAQRFVYDSRRLEELSGYALNQGISVLVINSQAFNSTAPDSRRIYESLDEFQSRRPIDVIRATRPILILDEPQKIEGPKTLEALALFEPLFALRYSATHRTERDKVFRLDALDAYNLKLVKKIAVRGVTLKDQGGSLAYVFLDSIAVSAKDPVARLEILTTGPKGPKRVTRAYGIGSDLAEVSDRPEYQGYSLSLIDASQGLVEFSNGVRIAIGEVIGDATEKTLRRIQIREAINVHLEKERALHPRGIKVLSLFFLDEVSKYRDYERPDRQGEYARVFLKEYQRAKEEVLAALTPQEWSYGQYLANLNPKDTHKGYFSRDQKTHRLVNPKYNLRGERAFLSDDVDAYQLILKDKERLLSFSEPVRFIFSHSALREGWDNPNVFVLCALKRGDSAISRRQEVGRGLRLCVNQAGERQDDPATVHEINALTVIAGESYRDFAQGLQKEISQSLAARPQKVDLAYFTGALAKTPEGEKIIGPDLAQRLIEFLTAVGYLDPKGRLTELYYKAKETGLVKPPAELLLSESELIELLAGIYSGSLTPLAVDGRQRDEDVTAAKEAKLKFLEIFARIERKGAALVEFDSRELIDKATQALNQELTVGDSYAVLEGEVDFGFKTFREREEKVRAISFEAPIAPPVKDRTAYILELSALTGLTQKTIGRILDALTPKAAQALSLNPDLFLSEAGRLINEKKGSVMVLGAYFAPFPSLTAAKLFALGRGLGEYFSLTHKLKAKRVKGFADGHYQDPLAPFYGPAPRGLTLKTPLGDYQPDWIFGVQEGGGPERGSSEGQGAKGAAKLLFFVAETKGGLTSLKLRSCVEEMAAEPIEDSLFAELGDLFATQSLTRGDNARIVDFETRFWERLNAAVALTPLSRLSYGRLNRFLDS
ncbi:MAG: DEAD/DEAH box helicase family protein [Deltaproteobacteria bacterium]|jgi:type III restriction enzyme|nr:DEAD/DEAH box helicase family protein [Deltaproteobacteria bacterium]